MDPVAALPALPLLAVFSCLRADDLARCAAVSRTWRATADSNELWDGLCEVRGCLAQTHGP